MINDQQRIVALRIQLVIGQCSLRVVHWAGVAVLALVSLTFIGIALFRNWRRSGLPFFSFFFFGTIRLYSRVWHRCTFPAPFRPPETGPALLVVNHTSSPDGCFVQCGSRRGLTFLVAEEFFKPWLHWFWGMTDCVPVNRSGSDIRSLRLGLRRLQEGRIVVVFPEGTLSGAGMGRLRTAKGGAAFLALHTDVPVFAAHISGGPQHPDVIPGWCLPSPHPVHIVYGRSLDMTPYRGRPINRALIEEVTAFLMRQIASLDPDCP